MKTKLIVKLMLLFGIVILASGCTHRPYRQNLPTNSYQKHTEITYGQNGQVIQKKEIIDEGTLEEPAEKFQPRYNGFYGRGRNFGGGYYGGRNAVRICIFGCDGRRSRR